MVAIQGKRGPREKDSKEKEKVECGEHLCEEVLEVEGVLIL